LVKRKACKKCRIYVTGIECPLCKSKDLSSNVKGRIIIFDANRSEIAKKLNIKVKGEYAIKTR